LDLDNSEKIEMPSGAQLAITLAPFADAKALYQAVLEELKTLKIDDQQEIGANIFKDLFCLGFSSKKIDACLDKCFQRVTYNDLKIDKDTWEKAEARGDYLKACIEVAKANLLPFVKSLSAEYSTVFQSIVGDLALRQKTPQS
jgi:hypothetical protein